MNDRGQRRNSRPVTGRPRPGAAGGRRQPDLVRRAVFDALVAVTARDAYANLVLPKLLTERRISGRDAAFATELTYGTLRTRGTLDAVLAACSTRPLSETDPRVLEMLRLGAYQLLYTRVPAHAAVAATVGVAKVALTDGPSRFVNAVLRRVSERDEAAWIDAVAPAREVDAVRHLALRHAHPEWIVRAFAESLRDTSPELTETGKALAADNERPTVHLAARPAVLDRDELVASVGGSGGPYSPYAVRLDLGGDPGVLDAVRSGRATVQDEGSQLAALALARATLSGPDARWLDMCAGPGGKAALLGALAATRSAQVTAVEVGEARAGLVSKATTGLPVTVVHADSRTVGEHPALPADGFDRVLLDAPCTGLGSLRRRPEARWRRQPGDIPALTKLQRELLDAAVRAVRPGGVIGYVTCSPHLAETRVMVAAAARAHGLEPLSVPDVLAEVPELGTGPTAQLWPHRHGTDAMFIALLRRPTDAHAAELANSDGRSEIDRTEPGGQEAATGTSAA